MYSASIAGTCGDNGNVQKLSIRIRITALFNFLDVLDSRLNGLSIDAIRRGVGRRHRFHGWGYALSLELDATLTRSQPNRAPKIGEVDQKWVLFPTRYL